MRKLLLLLVGIFVGNAMVNNYLLKRNILDNAPVTNKVVEDVSSREALTTTQSIQVKISVEDVNEGVETELAQYFGEETKEEQLAMKSNKRESEIQQERESLQKKLIQ